MCKGWDADAMLKLHSMQHCFALPGRARARAEVGMLLPRCRGMGRLAESKEGVVCVLEVGVAGRRREASGQSTNQPQMISMACCPLGLLTATLHRHVAAPARRACPTPRTAALPCTPCASSATCRHFWTSGCSVGGAMGVVVRGWGVCGGIL